MPSSPLESRKRASITPFLPSENAALSDEVFDLLWGHNKNIIPTAVDYAYKQIWKQLIFSPTDQEERLSDVTIAEKLGVSRTPVRQALERLVQEGLVRSDPRRGFWVRTFTAQ